MLRIQIVMKKKFPRKKRNIKRETRNELNEKSSRKSSTQEKIVPHLMRIIIVTVTRKEYALWQWKIRKEPLKMTKKIIKKASWILRQN
jgi:hypothetical protein